MQATAHSFQKRNKPLGRTPDRVGLECLGPSDMIRVPRCLPGRLERRRAKHSRCLRKTASPAKRRGVRYQIAVESNSRIWRSQTPVVATFRVRTSRGAPVVVVQTAEHGNGLDAAFGFGRPRNGLLLGESLVRTRLVVEAHVLGNEAPQVRLAHDQYLVEELPPGRSPEAPREALHL